MILSIDIGNSRIKWSSWLAEKIVARSVASIGEGSIEGTFDKLFSIVEIPTRVIAVCVAGNEMSQALSAWVKQHWQLDVEFLKTDKQFQHIINAYDDPRQHGADRWAAVVAGHLRYPDSSVCVICAGTAITFDLVNKSGQHLGGYILPSYVTMHNALLSDTADVKTFYDNSNDNSKYSKQFDKHSVPDNTSDAVNQGLHKLLQAGIRELCQFSKDKMGAPMHIILTGGFAKTILEYPNMPPMNHRPDLVMQGLYSIMRQGKD